MTRAREMLEFSRTSVDEIAASVGYETPEDFAAFSAIVGLAPSDYRRRFSVSLRLWPPCEGGGFA